MIKIGRALFISALAVPASAEMLIDSSFELPYTYENFGNDRCADEPCEATGRVFNDIGADVSIDPIGYARWRGNGNWPQVTTETDAVCVGDRGVKVHLNKWGEHANGKSDHRTEFRLSTVPGGTGNGSFRYRVEYWVSLMFKFPSELFPVNEAERNVDGATTPIVFQLHGEPDQGEIWRNPPFAMSFNHEGITEFVMRADTRAMTPNRNSYTNIKRATGPTLDEIYDRWVQLILHFEQDPENGWVDIYFDGEHLAHLDGGFGYNDRHGFYLIIGNYTYQWRDVPQYKDKIPFDETTHFYDAYKMARVVAGDVGLEDMVTACDEEETQPPPTTDPRFEYSGHADIKVFDKEDGGSVLILDLPGDTQ